LTGERPASVDICVCTFRRPFLAETLRSIANLQVRGLAVRVIVADNDAVPSAQPLVELMGRRMPFPLLYLHAPMSNISVARNACLDAAAADFVAFVDDDETVSENWLIELVRTAVTSEADVVLGPVQAEYDAGPRWLADGDFHSAAPVRVGGDILTGYTCNVLIRRRGAIVAQRFDLGLGQSGGEDTDYFSRLHDDLGARIAEAPTAIVHEPVPPSRATLGWLLRRRFRSGQTHGARLRVAGHPVVASAAAAMTKIAYCAIMTLATVLSPVGWRRNLLRGALHVGTLAGLAGTRQAALYGDGSAIRRNIPEPTATAVN
jgi:succinoglycan biosynthesis protein ExoM